MIMNVTNADLENMRNVAKELTEKANTFLKSVSPSEFETAKRENRASVFLTGFRKLTADQRSELGVAVVEAMCGDKATHKLGFGMVGSIWFDLEFSFGSVKDTARVALVPGAHRNQFGAGNVEFVFAVSSLSEQWE